jgi:hypothetical protein
MTKALRQSYAMSISSRGTLAPAQLTTANESPQHHEDAVIAKSVNGRLDSNYAVRPGEIPDRKPGAELISKARAEYGLMFGIPKRGSPHLSMLVTVEKYKPRIGAIIVGVHRTTSVQLDQYGRKLALFD